MEQDTSHQTGKLARLRRMLSRSTRTILRQPGALRCVGSTTGPDDLSTLAGSAGQRSTTTDDAAVMQALAEAIFPFAECAAQIAAGESDDEWAKFRLLIGNYRDAARALEAYRAHTSVGGL